MAETVELIEGMLEDIDIEAMELEVGMPPIVIVAVEAAFKFTIANCGEYDRMSGLPSSIISSI
jgi:hypothetical protein